MKTLHIIGGGLAGSEAAWQAAEAGIAVVIHEMRGSGKSTEAHVTDHLAELVCSNSFRNDDINSAIGLLHEEMRRCGSLIMRMADAHKVPAGGALAMDREGFSAAVQQALEHHPNITIVREEVTELPPSPDNSVIPAQAGIHIPEEQKFLDKKEATFYSTLPAQGMDPRLRGDDGVSDLYIIATGPLTSQKLAQSLMDITGEDHLAFFDAIAPIVEKDSIDFSKAWFQSRYDKPGPGGTGKDYINCPMSQAQYYAFIEALLAAEKTEFKEWEKHLPQSSPARGDVAAPTPYFEACLPIEVMAERGRETLSFGPMKPVGLRNPHQEEQPYAVVQLRQDNKLGTLWNMVGFQTKLKYGEQARIFRMIPGLEKAEFARLGGIHRNTFINSPNVLDETLRLKAAKHIRMAGQVTGVEGYVESAAIGLLAGRFAACELSGEAVSMPPQTTALGALLHHITQGHWQEEKVTAPEMSEQAGEPALSALHCEGQQAEAGSKKISAFQPMNVNFGLFPPLTQRARKKDRKAAYAKRALADLEAWLAPRSLERAA